MMAFILTYLVLFAVVNTPYLGGVVLAERRGN